MISIGNDIVALQKTNADRTTEEVFYSKILSQSEVDFYNKQLLQKLSFANFTWLAWSIKESVYKFQKRIKPKLLFSPVRIIIENVQFPRKQKRFNETEFESDSLNKEECFYCVVQFNLKKFYTRSFIYDDFIFSVANDTDCFKNIHWGIKKIKDSKPSSQSQEVREFALKKARSIFSNNNLYFDKSNAGFPFIAQQKNVPFSFTHHGNFVGYAFYFDAL